MSIRLTCLFSNLFTKVSWPTELSAEGHVTIQCVFQTYTTWKLIGIRHREEIIFKNRWKKPWTSSTGWKSDGCKKAYGNHPRATLVTPPPPLINQHEFLTVLILLYCAMDLWAKSKVFAWEGLKMPKITRIFMRNRILCSVVQGHNGLIPPPKKKHKNTLEWSI